MFTLGFKQNKRRSPKRRVPEKVTAPTTSGSISSGKLAGQQGWWTLKEREYQRRNSRTTIGRRRTNGGLVRQPEGHRHFATRYRRKPGTRYIRLITLGKARSTGLWWDFGAVDAVFSTLDSVISSPWVTEPGPTAVLGD